ncbi:hypothetical protein Pth03_78210 [Planotetraspora thailandica]|uniref:Uncharacterized protein n=2 Tax=Planotetraspora thailandica TaxID=487172 RepID=A0A8J4DG74_9ACTN|nr:hypothetical protein Pth03_78210 [Planotetraspora thailandica]
MARHLTHRADERGRLAELPAVMASYAAVHQVGIRTAWSDFRRLRELGYVRQTAAPCPGRAARYTLAVPADLPPELPRTLSTTVREEIDPAVDRARSRQTRVTMDAALSECEVIRHGSATGPKIAASFGCGRLHTSPYTREGSPPSPPEHVPRSRPGPRQARFGGVSDEEKSQALYIVKTCGPFWERQRGPGRGLPSSQVAEVAHLTALLLRHVPPSEAVELLTEQVASAEDLAAVVRFRIGRQLAAARRQVRVEVDEDGRGYAAMLQARGTQAAALLDQSTDSRQATRQALAAVRARVAAR